MKELYFHIGMPKTGTSALQKFLDTNRNVLRKKGIYYPAEDVEQKKYNFLIHSGNATYIKDIGLLGKDVEMFGSDELSCIDNLKSMFDSDDVVLLSNELYWYWGGILKALSALSFFLETEKITIKVIAYLRRQDEYLESMWNQRVKGRPCENEKCREYTYKEMLNPRYDYNALLSDISKIVGRGNIICRIYDPEKYSAENTIYAEFMRIFGIDDISDFELPKFQVNPSLSKNMVEIRRIFNAVEGSYNLSSIVRGIIGRKEYTKSEEKIVKHPSFLTYEQRKYILDYFEESNINLGREYFGIDGSPFAPLEKTVEDDEEDENDNSMYEDVIAFFGEILVKQQEKIENLDERLSYVTDEFELSKEIPDGSRIVVYGAKRKGRVVYNWIKRKQKYQALCIADQRADELQSFGLPICQPQEIFKMQYDYILISVDTKKVEDSIQQYLEENGVERERIIRAIG